VTGIASSEASWSTTIKRSGHSEQEWLATLQPAVAAAAQTYPRLREVSMQYLASNAEQDREDEFGWGLQRVLDGLTAAQHAN
jgi:hypothetical protein